MRFIFIYSLSTVDLKNTTGRERLDFIIFPCTVARPLEGIVAVAGFVIAGPNEAQGHTGNLLINSLSDNMLFTADGDQAAIGPDKLRVTGTLTSATCCRSAHCRRDQIHL